MACAYSTAPLWRWEAAGLASDAARCGSMESQFRKCKVECGAPWVNHTGPSTKAQRDMFFSGSTPLRSSSSTWRRRESKRGSLIVEAIAVGPESLDLAGAGPLALGLFGVGFGALRAVVYYRMQYITAAMLGRHVPRGGARVVDLCIRSGVNLYYLPNDVGKVLCIAAPGANPSLLKSQASQAGVDVTIQSSGPENIGAPTGSIDAVVSVYGFSRLPEDKVAPILGEVARVLKPGGKFIFVENVGAPGGIIRVGQEILERLYLATGIGSLKCRDLLPAIQSTSGLEDVQADMAMEFQDPHLVGVAVRSKASASKEVVARSGEVAGNSGASMRKSKAKVR